MDVIEGLRTRGFHVLRGGFGAGDVARLRGMVLDHLNRMANTPPTRSARHLGAIGPSGITINRPQEGHADLRRGADARCLTPPTCRGAESGLCVKALVYLQDGASLKVLPGSHGAPRDLRDDSASVPDARDGGSSVEVRAGDVVLTDIRLTHRGSTAAEMQAAGAGKIPVSTVFGGTGAAPSRAMRAGNAARMADWDARWPGVERAAS